MAKNCLKTNMSIISSTSTFFKAEIIYHAMTVLYNRVSHSLFNEGGDSRGEIRSGRGGNAAAIGLNIIVYLMVI